MIKINNTKIRIMLLLAAVLAIGTGVFRAFLLVNYIEPETGFYITGTNLGTVFAAVCVLLGAIILASGFCVRKIPAPEHLDSRSTVVVFTSALCAFLYISLFFYSIYRLLNSGTATDYFLVVETLLCIPCCLNHISVCSAEVREKNTPHALLAMSEALFFAIRVVEVFMDKEGQINSSQRALELVMLCSMMVFFLLEAEFLVVREEGNLKSLSKYLMSGLASVVFPIVAVVPYLAVSLFWCFEADFVIMDVLECSIMLFAASRILHLKPNKE